ncbi:MAG: LuxR C-terminal-related transcriptional regulator, partial [Microbacterium sp.]|uniref:response regulator transcription factor n=1 Tax=Microbacterium sp. TaxID=51671 RepID=UPI0039E4317B
AKHGGAAALQLAWAQARLGRTGEAAATLAGLDRARPSPRDALGADVLRAAIALSADEEEPADAVAVRIAEQVRATGMRLPFALLTDDARARLVASAERVGESELATQVQAGRPDAPAVRVELPRLTERERAVLGLLAETTSTAQLAARLFVSVNTVKTQLRSLYRKLGVTSRTQAIARAVALGLSSPPHQTHREREEGAS